MKTITKKISKPAGLFICSVLISTTLLFANEKTFSGMIEQGAPVQISQIIPLSDIVGKTLKYSSNLKSVAVVDSLTGVVTGKFPGTAIITISNQAGDYKTIFTAIVYGQTLILPSVLSNNMVIQQKTHAALWGWTSPNSNVQITASWGQIVNAVADSTGKWSTKIKTPKAIAGDNQIKHTLTFEGKNNSITLSNILVGDVYLCSGQSNMAFAMDRLLDSQNELAIANYPNIRINKPGFRKEHAPFFHGISSWKECTSENVKTFSAVAYLFARKLYTNPKINIPIGLIAPAVGGSSVQSWISRDALIADSELKSKVQDVHDLNPTLEYQSASNILYNGMLSSCIPFSLRGFLWYQGEANNRETNYRDLYHNLLSTLITSWRAEWGQGNLPFYFVQLPAHSGLTPVMRDQQSQTLIVPNTGMAVTLDLADTDLNDIHPHNKNDVGIRLAKIAEAKIYKQKVVYAGPMLQSFKIEGNKIRIKYQKISIGTGLISRDGKVLNHFQIAGSDNVFVDATAVIDGEDVVVSAQSVRSPKNVAFAWVNTAIPNLTNKEGLMACPFRTDKWNYNVKLK